jgi:hypothetical protein
MRLDFAGTRAFQDKPPRRHPTRRALSAVSGAFGMNADRNPHFFAGMRIGADD